MGNIKGYYNIVWKYWFLSMVLLEYGTNNNLKLNMNLTPKETKLAKQYGDYLAGFCERALEKFICGIIEHRDQKFEDLDYDKEIEAEILDLIGYSFGKSLKK